MHQLSHAVCVSYCMVCTRLAPVHKTFFINVSYHILVASLTLIALFKTEPSELDQQQVYDMTR